MFVPSGEVTFAAGHIGEAAHFDGSSYLHTTEPLGVTLGDTDWTVTGWARTPDPNVEGKIISRVGRFEFRVYFQEGNIGANAFDSSDIVFPASADTWTYFRLSFIAATNTIEFEINNNGAVQTGLPGGDIEDSGAPLYIGCQDQGGGPANFLTGSVDAIKLFTKVLDTAEQVADYNSGAGIEYN